jgi:hypothetical protein
MSHPIPASAALRASARRCPATFRARVRVLLRAIPAVAALAGSAAFAAPAPIPRLVEQNGRHALLVDGKPFLLLGGQCHNSSAWPVTLPAVWRDLGYMNANTLEAPIYWEQFEPQPGQYDTSLVDQLIDGARAHHVRLVLLWFGTWKNGSSHYLPLWMKAQPDRFPRMQSGEGRPVDSPSPHSAELLQADIRAFRALMRHLKHKDPQRTVIMVQVENEPGTWGGAVRDFSPAAEKAFTEPVPPELSAKLRVAGGRNWRDTFGDNADEFFHAWSVGRFIGQVAAAGKEEYPLPLYVNVALRDPLKPGPASTYESGGPTDNVIELWKAAAPAIDLLAPDIYQREPEKYLKVLDLYGLPDNALFVPETIGASPLCRHFFDALGHGAIGWAPFGIDRPHLTESEWLKASTAPDYALAGVARIFDLAGAAMRPLARLNFEGRVHAMSEREGQPEQLVPMQQWQARISYGVPPFGRGRNPKGNAPPTGGFVIAELGPDDFLVGGTGCWIDFAPSHGAVQREYLRVEEVRVNDEELQVLRIWNGDETDYGLNFSNNPVWVHVKLRTY